ncbi:MAG: AMP-binding protein [Prevotella sp.]
MEKENHLHYLDRLSQSLKDHARRNCFFIEKQNFTYRELDKLVQTIRESLITIKDEFIGLVINDDLETYAAILAIWMEGKAYVPLHPQHPIARCMDIILQMGIVTVMDSSKETRYKNVAVIRTAGLKPIEHSIERPVKKGNTAYVLFTSGSTGKPKGVPISVDNVASFVNSFESLGITVNAEDRCLQMFDLTFDLSVFSYLIPLLNGACAYTVKSDSIKWQEIFMLFDEQQLTFALMVPSVIHYMCPYLHELEAKSLRHTLFAGEALLADEMEAWQKAVPQCRIWNVYGPTEDTIFCTAYALPTKGVKSINNIVSIGKSMPGNRTDIMDVDEKGIGELCLSGNQLTLGYWQNEEKNRQAFFYKNNQRWYHTGDLCSIDHDGDIMYHGRMDSQVQIQGFRVELGEIECVASRFFTESTATVAVAIADSEGFLSIHLAVEGCQKEMENPLKLYLSEFLPSYMIPSQIHFMDKFPQNTSNKIDRKRIKEMYSFPKNESFTL